MQKTIPALYKSYLQGRQSAQGSARGDSTITWRGIGVGAAMCVLIAIGVPYGGLVIQGTRLGLSSATPAAFFLLFVLLLTVHLGLGCLRRSWAFTRGELLVIFSMMVVATAIPTRGVTGMLLPMITGATYYATPENKWLELIHPLQPLHLLVGDKRAITAFYEGSPGAQIPWEFWLPPLMHWLVFFAALYLSLVSLLVIFRRQWVEHERLAYPMVQLPLAMVADGEEGRLLRPFFKNRLMWAGLLIPLLFNSLNALHHYDPMYPAFKIDQRMSIFDESVMLRLNINFLILGFTYLINSTLTLSIWFFYLVHLVQERVLTLMGTGVAERTLGQWSEPGMGHQMMGALFVLVLYGVWIGRVHIRSVLAKALGRDRQVVDDDEMLSYRGAVLGAVVGLGIMAGWLWLSGIPAWIVPFVLLSALVIFIGLARVVAEAGLPTVTPGMVSAALTVSCIGVPALGAKGLVAVSYTLVWIGDLLVFMAAPLANILRLGSDGVRRRPRLLGAIGLAMAISLVVSVWFTLHLAYRYGAVNLHQQYFSNFAIEPTVFAVRQLDNLDGADWSGWLRLGGGGAAMAALMYARSRFYWWPFHPLGFATSMGWVMNTIWFSVFLAWALKLSVMRFGGIKSYERSKYFFMGLALGQVVSGGIWLVIDGLTGVVGHRIRVY